MKGDKSRARGPGGKEVSVLRTAVLCTKRFVELQRSAELSICQPSWPFCGCWRPFAVIANTGFRNSCLARQVMTSIAMRENTDHYSACYILPMYFVVRTFNDQQTGNSCENCNTPFIQTLIELTSIQPQQRKFLLSYGLLLPSSHAAFDFDENKTESSDLQSFITELQS